MHLSHFWLHQDLQQGLDDRISFSPVFKFLCFLTSQPLYECKLFTIAFVSSGLSLPQACLKACLSSLFLLFVVGSHSQKSHQPRAGFFTISWKICSAAGGEASLDDGSQLLHTAFFRLGCLASFHWQHLLEPLFAVNLAAILLSLFCKLAVSYVRCNYVHAMCCLGEVYAVLSKKATHTPCSKWSFPEVLLGISISASWKFKKRFWEAPF